MPYRFVCRIALVAILLLGFSSWSAADVVLQGGGGTYTVQATNLEGVLGMILEIDYDPEFLTIAPPYGVEKGADIPGGTIWSSSKPEEGTLRIVIANVSTPLKSGTLARVTFTVRTGNKPPMPSLRATITATSQVSDPPPAARGGQQAPPTGGYSGGGGSAQSGYNDAGRHNTGEGEEFVPDEPLQPEPEFDSEPPPPPAYVPPTPTRTQEPTKSSVPAGAGTSAPSATVLERFRTFTGERTIENFLGLFNSPPPQGMKQDPPLAIADGTASVTVTVRVPSKENVTPTFNLYYARLTSLEQADDGSWVLNVVPAQGKVIAIVSALMDTGVVDFPLNIAPPVSAEILNATPLTEEGFRQFVKETGTAEHPLHDVNGDGKRDYIDDYIFSTNYMVAHTKNSGKGAGRR